MATQRIQLMQVSVSVCEGDSAGIARTGHFCAQSPHEVQPFPALGFMGTPLYSLYGVWPGSAIWLFMLSASMAARIFPANSPSCASSSKLAQDGVLRDSGDRRGAAKAGSGQDVL